MSSGQCNADGDIAKNGLRKGGSNINEFKICFTKEAVCDCVVEYTGHNGFKPAWKKT